jgi:NAD(P)-dependent dehydrogenase (short-subunit alcohol dehydrogenase family)
VRTGVFTCSTTGEKAERTGRTYTASKHGVIGLARAVAPRRWAVRSQIQRCAAPLGANGNGRALGEDSGQTERNRRRARVARTRRHLRCPMPAIRHRSCVSIQSNPRHIADVHGTLAP